MRCLLICLAMILLSAAPARAAIVAGQSCTVGDTSFYGGTYFTCPSGQWVQQTITSTIQVGTTTATCTAENNGLLRIQTGLLQVCVGTSWRTVLFL